MDLAACAELGSGFDFAAWFDAIGKPAAGVGDVNVNSVEGVKCAAQLILEVEPDTLEHYLRWRAAKAW